MTRPAPLFENQPLHPPSEIPRRVSAHAKKRWTERVSRKPRTPAELLANPKENQRCENGVLKIFKKATHIGRSRGATVFVVRTRALIVKDGCVITVIVSGRPTGFGKRQCRAWGLVPIGDVPSGNGPGGTPPAAANGVYPAFAESA